MIITSDLSYSAENTQEVAINVETGALVVTLDTDGATSSIAVTEPSKLIIPEKSKLTFALNGDTATITRL